MLLIVKDFCNSLVQNIEKGKDVLIIPTVPIYVEDIPINHFFFKEANLWKTVDIRSRLVFLLPDIFRLK